MAPTQQPDNQEPVIEATGQAPDTLGVEGEDVETQGIPTEDASSEQADGIESPQAQTDELEQVSIPEIKKKHPVVMKVGAVAAGLLVVVSGAVVALRGGGSTEPVQSSNPIAEQPTPSTEQTPVTVTPEVTISALTIGNINTALVKPGESFYTDVRGSGEAIKIPKLRDDKDVNAYISAFLANIAWAATQDTPTSRQAFANGPDFSVALSDIHTKLLADRHGEDHPEDVQVLIFDTKQNNAIFTKYGDPSDPKSLPVNDSRGRETIELTGGTLYMKSWANANGHSEWQKIQDPESAYTYVITKLIVRLDPITKQYAGIQLEWKPL